MATEPPERDVDAIADARAREKERLRRVFVRVERPEAFGASHPQATLTAFDVRGIRDRYEASDATYSDLAAEYGVSPSEIGKVVRREVWTHV